MAATRLHFSEELEALRHRLLEMGSEVDRMLRMAVQALTEQDITLAEEVIAHDDLVDRLDLELEGECMRLIALQQPLARDLRLIGTVLKVITDLERIGDHSVDIAKVARHLIQDTFYQPLVDLPRMAESVRHMLNQAMQAFVNHDLEQVETVVLEDDEVDMMFHRIREELHTVMQRDPALVVQASYLLFVAHYLERVADHTVNIAERVHYVETGSLSQLAKSHKTAS
ncbi:MAG TPA: phosphate signaling complex protein PhoU [Chthonomonadaceae bacterium]|nr:phosphate signaling complex protein PhoU [Chthonomonadaceae bacterium]